jgi:hypothetical protein
MSVDSVADLFRDTKFGQALVEQGLEQGREEGLEQGLEQGAVRLLTALLHDRFGFHSAIPVLARRLNRWPDSLAAVHAITSATSLDDLLNAQPPA